MNKTDLYNEIAYEMVLSKKEARQVVDMVFDLMAKALIAGDEIKITDFFSLISFFAMDCEQSNDVDAQFGDDS